MVTAKHCMYVARVWCQRHYPWRRWRICTKSPRVGVRNNRTEKLNLLNTANTIKFSFMSVCSEVAPDKTFCQRRVGLKIGVAAFFLSQFGDSRGWRLILCPFVRWQILLSDRHIGSILSPKNWPVGSLWTAHCSVKLEWTSQNVSVTIFLPILLPDQEFFVRVAKRVVHRIYFVAVTRRIFCSPTTCRLNTVTCLWRVYIALVHDQ